MSPPLESNIATRSCPFLEKGGETGDLIRSFDWTKTSLGTPDHWPQSLCTTLGIVLHSAFPMFLFWGKDLICFYNDAFRPSLGMDGKHPAIGKKGREVWPEIWEFIGPLIEQVMSTGEPVWFEDQLVPFYRNGRMEEIYWTFSYSPAYDDNCQITGVFVTCTETTEKVLAVKKIEEIVNERTRELEIVNNNLKKSNAELAQFAYIASHDLQEPLRKIRTFSHMLENQTGDKMDEHARNYLRKINSASLRMHTLIRDVLTYSELAKTGNFFSEVNLNQTIDSVLADYELLIEQKGATIHVKNLPTLEAIPFHMSQLFGNLIGNALKFAKKDIRLVITITGSKPSKEELTNSSLNPQGDFYKIQVADNGIGFKKEYGEQIFNIFQRLHRKSEFEGTGIGLAMCKKIALNHHGDINADGSSECGAVFNVILPAKHVHTTR